MQRVARVRQRQLIIVHIIIFTVIRRSLILSIHFISGRNSTEILICQFSETVWRFLAVIFRAVCNMNMEMCLWRFRFNAYGRRVFSIAGSVRSETLFRILSGTRQSVRTVSEVYWNVFVRSILSHPARYGFSPIMRCINPLIYLLTYLLIHLHT